MSHKLDFVTADFSKISKSERYFLMGSAIVPRPIAVVATLHANGSDNLAPFSYFNAVSTDPPCIMFSVSPKRDRITGATIDKDTIRNIKALPEFVVHIAQVDQLDWVESASDDFAFGESEREKLGLHSVPSTWIRVPRVQEFAIAMECKLEQLVELNGTTMVIGRILGVHYRSDLREPAQSENDHRLNAERLQPLARLGRGYGAVHVLADALKK